MTMAETAVESTTTTTTITTTDKTNNNHPLIINNNHRPIVKQRKRKRLSQVLDKLANNNQSPCDISDELSTLNNNHYTTNNNVKDMCNEETITKTTCKPFESLKFDIIQQKNHQSEDEDVFSPASSSNKSPHSSTESPRISFSPLRLKEDDASCSPPLQKSFCPCYHCVGGGGGGGGHHTPPTLHPYDRFFPAPPISPLTPSSASPAPTYSFERYLHSKYLPDIFRRRSHSDSDLPLWFESAKADNNILHNWPHSHLLLQHHHHHQQQQQNDNINNKESQQSLLLLSSQSSSNHQDSPLDLSIKNKNMKSLECLVTTSPLSLLPSSFLPPRVSVPVVKGDVASPTTKESVASRYNLEVSPVVEEMPPGSDVAYVCPVCGQMFSLHDRLAKHMASRHKSRQTSGETTAKAYLCEVCQRSFARSDMLTRHMRLHTGVKPYTCRVCGQVFSRSDHLSTHQRTHTGEKPYKCPQCPYAACRRDMITRHMRTHTRYEPETLPSTVKTENH